LENITKHNYKKMFWDTWREMKIGAAIVVRSMQNGLSPWDVFRKAAKDKQIGVGGAYFAYTTYLTSPEEYMPMQEYIDNALWLNDLSLSEAADAKYTLYVRTPEFMGREAIDLNTANDTQIALFAITHKKFVGKTNWGFGRGFKVFHGTDKDVVQQVRASHVVIIEEWITQHHDVSEIYSNCVNSIRIHTVRNSNGVRLFLKPVMCVGSRGAETNQTEFYYRLFLNDDGRVLSSFIQNNKQICWCEKHCDSGCCFKEKEIPFVNEACNLVVEAAEYMPELRFLAWDVAITPKGPVIVEVNSVSGAINIYQLMNAMCTRKGLRSEVQEMLDYGMEGVVYDTEHNFAAESFALTAYINELRLPTLFERYTVLLQSALHRHGIDFWRINEQKTNIGFKLEGKQLTLNMGDKTVSWQLSENPPENLYESDRHAMKLAAEIYKELKDNVIA